MKTYNKIILICSIFLLQTEQVFAFDFDFFGGDEKRSTIHSVGSSTISPLMATVSEEFSRSQNLKNIPTKTPLVESTGTSEGFKFFCAGIGYKYPDFINASRAIERSDIEACHKNKITEIIEIKIGYDGIVIGNSKIGKKIKLTKQQIFLALADKIPDKKSGGLIQNPYKKWSEISSTLPDNEIKIYGPPLTSGTRRLFTELAMEDICINEQQFIAAYPDLIERKKQCTKFREDSAFIESGENDNLIITNLKKDPNAIGIFGFNFLIANSGAIQAASINNIEPSFGSISSKKYQLSRPLFVYFKKDNLALIPQMKDFIEELISLDTIGHKGYLIHSGLVPLSTTELASLRKKIFTEIK